MKGRLSEEHCRNPADPPGATESSYRMLTDTVGARVLISLVRNCFM